VLSQSNVRRIKAGVSVEELAEDIARRGLLQSLNVRPVLDADGVATGTFEIPAGGRRFQALSLLVKQKRLAKAAPIPCIVRDAASDILAEDDSLAENMQRVALHPLDQFRAFVALREKGQGEEAIAAAFFVTPQIVKQRLKLASVAPALLEVYAEDRMTLEQLMAFTVNPDHARQEQVWDAVKNSWNKEPYAIRRMLTETSVRASDRRAVFVGVDAYEAAGGVVLRDLFQGDDGGWLEDPALLDQLVSEKLQAEAEALTSEGWKWIEVATDLPYGYSHGLRRLVGDPAPMTDEESAAHAALLSEYRRLEEEYSGQDEYPEEIDARLGQLEIAMEALDQRPLIYDPVEVARAGAFVTLDRDGSLASYRGYVRPEDEPREETAVQEGDGLDAMGQGGDVGVSNWKPSATFAGGTIVTSGGQPIGADASDQGSRLALLAHCLSFGINALHEKVNPYGAGISASGLTRRMAHADLVARAVDLDMVEAGWEPTVDGYLNRVPKARILEAVREAKWEGTAQLLDHLKKGEMATEAERLLKGSGWLPEVLRRADLVASDGEGIAEGQGEDAGQPEDVDLPAFLTADLPDSDASMMAAE
jgi:ParB family chromosome partitioning protein